MNLSKHDWWANVWKRWLTNVSLKKLIGVLTGLSVCFAIAAQRKAISFLAFDWKNHGEFRTTADDAGKMVTVEGEIGSNLRATLLVSRSADFTTRKYSIATRRAASGNQRIRMRLSFRGDTLFVVDASNGQKSTLIFQKLQAAIPSNVGTAFSIGRAPLTLPVLSTRDKVDQSRFVVAIQVTSLAGQR